MLHHVGIEVAPAEIERTVELWQLLGFELVEPPASLSEFTWLERGGTQVHLMPTESPTVPPRGHTAIVVADFGAPSRPWPSTASRSSAAANTGACPGRGRSPPAATGSS